ncbi:MAG: F0F1 ATP synthase subunit A [Proteobacteria bacterium]|jgi:F-type H+-transporting ATPase subunit a|nr:F0F1 ATP synthase subunit A [Desulfobacterales bacterium]MBL7171759.1 F0F1 ATP synthase subunit A [Desulfobacteraceae bacterium]MBU0733546.1 F0F1 ATP synthase subunit A [Pseudomonadota bacterium]MBU1905167.1 F0F1 ATP synthase subunit A [Pseudomonadota bacterium]
MEHPIFFIDAILSAMGVKHASAYSHVTYTWLVMLILIASAFLLARKVKIVPEKGQNFFEVLVDGLETFMVDITGPEGRLFFPYIASIFLFILVSNLIGLIPGCFSPTANLNTTLALALCTFIYTHVIGVKFHGVKYLKHFCGPVWWLTPLMLPIELIGHLARIMSLSVRLFGNIFGKEMVLAILFGLAGLYLAPLPILFLGLLVCFIQALVFMLLSTMYFVGAMEHAH